jgi:glutathionylspermidine synthase
MQSAVYSLSMSTPVISDTDRYAAFARELVNGCVISDPWIEGRERFRLQPVVLSDTIWKRLSTAAEAIGSLFNELSIILWDNPHFIDDFFHLTPYQKLMWLSSGGRWHGIARLDLFILADGTIRTCEMNSDTPSGEAEAVILNRILHRDHANLIDPNQFFEERFIEMVIASHQATVTEVNQGTPTVGIIYPTELTEDLSMITLYSEWFADRGLPVVVGSPFNLHRRADGRLLLFDTPIDIIVRHYKTDWWSERIPVWLDEDDFQDSDPLDRELLDIIGAETDGRIAVVNPFGAVVTQNKLAMAFCWEHIELFSPESQHAIHSYLPETRRLSDRIQTPLEQHEWTLKSDYGCEGDEVIIGQQVSPEIWEQSIDMAVAHRWIAQRYFDAAADTQGMIPNYGVYLIAGKTAGIFTRLAPKATDYHAVTAPTFIRPETEL